MGYPYQQPTAPLPREFRMSEGFGRVALVGVLSDQLLFGAAPAYPPMGHPRQGCPPPGYPSHR